MIKEKLRISSFFALNVSQTLITLNDSIFRLIVIYSLIDMLGTEKSNQILAISATLFVSPFLVISQPAGQLADKFSKRTILLVTLWAEFLFMIIGLFAIYARDVFSAYFALFLIALQSSVFNPSKYAILPELVEKKRISQVNGIMTLCTYLAIILGTFLASFISEITHRNYLLITCFCVVIALIALISGYFIQKTPAQDPSRKINMMFVVEIYRSLKEASKYPKLLLACFSSAYFLFTAAYTQLNLIPFGIQSLGITDVQAGYIYLAAAMGVGLGSTMVAMLSGKNVELGITIWGAFGTGLSYFFLFFFQHHLAAVILLIISVGMHGGLYVVPLDAYIQVTSPEKKRGAIVAASTFLSFLAVLFSAGYLALIGEVLSLSAATGFFIVSLATLALSCYILFSLPDHVTRIIAVILSRLFLSVNIDEHPKQCFLICKKRSIVKFFSLIHSFQKIRFISWTKKPVKRSTIRVYKIFNRLPVYINPTDHLIQQKALDEIRKEVEQGYSVCLFLDDEKFKRLPVSKECATRLVQQQLEIPSVRASIEKLNGTKNGTSFFHFFKILHGAFRIHFSPKTSKKAPHQEASLDLE